MKEVPALLSPREQQIAELLLQGCDNAEIARQLKMARRTVKAQFNRLFSRFGIHDGIKRVKLATLIPEASTFGGDGNRGLPFRGDRWYEDSAPSPHPSCLAKRPASVEH